MKFDLWRILGNDLPPRHSESQTEDNVDFILERESAFENCRKLFLLNRIIDPEKEKRLHIKLSSAGHRVIAMKFEREKFISLDSMQARAHYLTNVNYARNYCVELSLSEGADVVCPMDGGMYFTYAGWDGFSQIAKENSRDGYFAFVTWRLLSYADVLDTTILPQFKSEYYFGDQVSCGLTELQLALTRHADQRFDESLMYGRADKVEFLYRLGMRGLWDHWAPQLRIAAMSKKSKFYDSVRMSLPGFVCRLPSGNCEADHNNETRGIQRFKGVNNLLAQAGS